MSTLIIKLTQDGLSQDFLLNGPGPLYIGSDETNDICVDAEGVGPKVLEVKISNGTIVVKEVGSLFPILLNSSVLPRGANVRYREGDRLSIKNTSISFQIEKATQEAFDSARLPNEVHSKLKQADDLIRERKLQIKRLSESKEKKKEQLFRMEEKYQQYVNDKIRIESEVKSMKGKKLLLEEEIQQTIKKGQENEDRVNQLKVFVERLQDEEKKLKDNISSQNIVLSNFQDEKERKSKEADSKRLELVKLEAEEVKLQRSISELQQIVSNKKNEVKIEEDRFKDALLRSEIAQKEKSRLEDDIFKLENERKKIEDEIRDCADHLRKTESLLIEAKESYAQLKFEIENEEENIRQVKNNITAQRREEENLKRMNTELRMELSKAEEKISYKRDQLNNLDYKNQEVSRKLAQVTFELERSSVKIEEFASEERAQELKILALREDMESLLKKYNVEKEEIEKKLFSEREKYEVEILYVSKLLTEKEQKSSTLEKDYLRIKSEYDLAKDSLKSLLKEKSTAESEMKTFRFNKTQLSEKLERLREEINALESDKADHERELARIKIRVLDSENKIVEDQEKARLEMESYKREERSKMLAEKEVSLAEVAALKQKAMTEVDSEFRKKQEEFHKLKEIAQEKADEIIKEARRVETDITNEAQRRLRSITDDVSAREKEAHDRVKSAQEFFKEKEKEAEQIILQARLKSREVAKAAEAELQEELGERKQKIKKFLTYKQDIGLAHIEKREQEHLLKLKKLEEFGLQKVEEVKRKELKKIAKLCSDEFEKQRAIREKSLLELNADKARRLSEISQMRTRQEQELAEKKREVIEQINTMKYEQSRLWKEELKSQKEAFNRSKKERIQNATDAVMNILVAEFGSQDEKVEALRNKVLYNLESAIEGQKAKVMKEVDHVIDFSTAKQKKIWPVLQKYAFKVALPVVTAIVMLGDIGGARTYTVEGVKEILRQQHSASEIYAEQQKANWKEKYTYNPDTTVGFKDTFFDNILYTTKFEEVVNSEAFQNDWILKLNDYMVRDLELSEDIVISYISAEGALISEMSEVRKELNPQILDVGFEKLREVESRHLGWLEERISDASKLEKFKEFRKSYFDNFYAQNYANPDRAIASEPEKTE